MADEIKKVTERDIICDFLCDAERHCKYDYFGDRLPHLSQEDSYRINAVFDAAWERLEATPAVTQ